MVAELTHTAALFLPVIAITILAGICNCFSWYRNRGKDYACHGVGLFGF